jgi:hypothetical protein
MFNLIKTLSKVLYLFIVYYLLFSFIIILDKEDKELFKDSKGTF